MDKLHKILISVFFAVIIILIAGLVFLRLHTAESDSQSAGAPSTQVLKYVPDPTASANLSLESGYCFADSISAPYRADAWRCMVGNAISDPCFQIPGADNLLCDPNVTGSFLLSLTQPLPTPQIPITIPKNWAWRVQLTDGTVCAPFTGTRPFSASGEVAVYSCDGGANEQMIFGDLNNSKPIWTAKTGALSNPAVSFPPNIINSKIVSVAKVWQ